MFSDILRSLVTATALCLTQIAVAESPVVPLGIGLEGIDYPYPVGFFDLTLEGQPLRMAYMDVPPVHQPNGGTVVLLHGKSFSGDYWGATIRYLTTKGYRVIVPDQLGFGKSSKPDMHYSFDVLTRATKQLLDQVGVTKAAIVGHSFGGMLAVYFARTYPAITAALILENPIGLEDYRSAIPPQTLETLFQTEMAQTPDSYRGFMKAFFLGWPSQAEHQVEVFTRMLQSGEYPRAAKASALTYRMIYEQPIRHEYGLLKLPVLLVIGQGDRSVFFRRYAKREDIAPLGHWPELGRAAVKELPDGKLVEIEGSGHVPHIEQPEPFLAALGAFLSERYQTVAP